MGEMSAMLRYVRVITFIHIFLLSNALIGYWPNAYMFYNFLFVLTLFWVIKNRESKDPPITNLVINATAFFCDIMCLVFDFKSITWYGIVFGIINWLFRLVSSFVVYSYMQEIDSCNAPLGCS